MKEDEEPTDRAKRYVMTWLAETSDIANEVRVGNVDHLIRRIRINRTCSWTMIASFIAFMGIVFVSDSIGQSTCVWCLLGIAALFTLSIAGWLVFSVHSSAFELYEIWKKHSSILMNTKSYRALVEDVSQGKPCREVINRFKNNIDEELASLRGKSSFKELYMAVEAIGMAREMKTDYPIPTVSSPQDALT